jgi:hypothetical protein
MLRRFSAVPDTFAAPSTDPTENAISTRLD